MICRIGLGEFVKSILSGSATPGHVGGDYK